MPKIFGNNDSFFNTKFNDVKNQIKHKVEQNSVPEMLCQGLEYTGSAMKYGSYLPLPQKKFLDVMGSTLRAKGASGNGGIHFGKGQGLDGTADLLIAGGSLLSVVPMPYVKGTGMAMNIIGSGIRNREHIKKFGQDMMKVDYTEIPKHEFL